MDPLFAYKIHTEKIQIEKMLLNKKANYEEAIQRSRELDELILRYLKERKQRTI